MHFREVTVADRERILALRARCFPGVDPEKEDPRFWDWLASRSRSFVGEEDGALLTHLTLLAWQGNVLAIEAMTSPDARGRGAFTGVMRHALANAGAVVTAFQIRGAVFGTLMRTGWKVARRVPVLMRPVPLWKRKCATFSTFDARQMSNISRNKAEIAWRFFENPAWQYRVTGVENAAYLVARRTKLKGMDTYAIVDLAWRDVKVAKALLRNAICEAKAQGCTLVAALVSRDHPAFWLFVRNGFLPGPYHFRFLVHPPEHATRRWPLMWADTDHL
ncbi:MAG TPA: GNAT family N-acetyltransferase [Thermoanaerobaculia bacterium]